MGLPSSRFDEGLPQPNPDRGYPKSSPDQGGTPSSPDQGYPHQPDEGTPIGKDGEPPVRKDRGTHPSWEGWGVPLPTPPSAGRGYPLFHDDVQSENITFCHPSDANGNNQRVAHFS